MAVVIALTLVVALPATSDAAKKRKNRTRVVDITMPVNAPIPDAAPANGPNGLLTSAIQVGGKQLKGKRIRDVNVTVQTTGLTGSVPTKDLVGYLTAPNGTTTGLFSRLGLIGTGFSIGPLTLDDESTLGLGFGDQGDPTSLEDPWNGTARPDEPGLYVMDDGPVSGTWTLHVRDTAAGATSRFVFWRLVAVAGPPYKTK